MTGKPDRSNPLDELTKLLVKVLLDCERFSDLLDSRKQLITELIQVVQRRNGAPIDLQAVTRKQAEIRGVRSVEMIKLNGKRTKVIIDGLDSFTLAPRMARFLKLLIEDDGSSEDDFVPWKSSESIKLEMGGGLKPISQTSLTTNINRLRNTIESHSIYPRGLVLHEGHRLRFFLRRPHTGIADR